MKDMERALVSWRDFLKKWRGFSDRADATTEQGLEIFPLLIVSLFYCVLWRPFEGLFRRKTGRFESLSSLRFDALCLELAKGKDFCHGPYNENRMTYRELRQIASHILDKCLLGAVDNKPHLLASDSVRPDGFYPEVFPIFAERDFWMHVYGLAVDQMHIGVAVGFYFGVALTVLVFWLLN